MQWFTTGVSTTLVLILLGIISFFLLFAHHLSASVKENMAITMLLKNNVDEEEIQKFRTVLAQESYILAIDYISKEQALIEQTEAMGNDPSEFLGYNPFTPSFELRLKAVYANSDSLAWIVDALKNHAIVDEVMYPRALVDAININLHRASCILLVVAALLALVSFSLITSTVRLSIFASRFIIRTMKLVGAQWSFIRRPFMWRGFRLGIFSGLISDSALYAGVQTLINYDPSLREYINPEMLLAIGLIIPIFGILLTLSCTYISVGKYLHMRNTELN